MWARGYLYPEQRFVCAYSFQPSAGGTGSYRFCPSVWLYPAERLRMYPRSGTIVSLPFPYPFFPSLEVAHLPIRRTIIQDLTGGGVGEMGFHPNGLLVLALVFPFMNPSRGRSLISLSVLETSVVGALPVVERQPRKIPRDQKRQTSPSGPAAYNWDRSQVRRTWRSSQEMAPL